MVSLNDPDPNDMLNWLSGSSARSQRQPPAFNVSQLIDLPEPLRELMLEINRSEPVSLAELSRTLGRDQTLVEMQINQLMAQNWLDMQEDALGEWVYRIRMSPGRKRILPPGIWQSLDDRWQIPIFRLFPDAVLEDFSDRFELEHYREGVVLFNEGDWGERMYIVDNGQINLSVQNERGETWTVRQVGSGGIIGEMAVLWGERRPHTARITQEARVWTLNKTDLDYLLVQHPSAGLSIRRELARYMKPLHRDTSPILQHNPVVVVGESGARLALALAEQVTQPVLLIDLIGASVGAHPHLTSIDGRTMRSKAIAERIQSAAENQNWVVVASFPQMTDQLMRVIGLAEAVIDLTGSGAPWLRAASRRYWSKPTSTPLQIARLARKLCGQVTGLTLSGGAARCMAHLGVLDVLDQAHIQFDLVSACGYGALWGSLYAAGWPVSKMIDLALGQMSKLQPFGGWIGLRPTARPGLFDIRPVRNLVRSVLGDLTFEELETPCYLTASDLTSGEQIEFSQGSLFNAVSACLATPGLVTPVEHQNRLLVDAILSNPLPANLVAAQGADLILVSSVIPTSGARQKRTDNERPDLVTGWLDVCDMIANTHANEHLRNMDMIITPDVAEFSDTAFEQAETLIERGRQMAQQMLPHIQSLLRRQTDEKNPDRG